MLAVFRKLLALLSRRERIQLGLLLVALLVMAFLELVGIAAVLPFLYLASDPARLQEKPWLAWAYEAFGFASPTSFLIALGGIAFTALVLSNTWAMITIWVQYRFAHGHACNLSVRLLRHYSAQPYVFFLRRNGADLGKNVLHEVEMLIDVVLMPALRLCTQATVALGIIGLLVAFDPVLALLIVLVLGGAYGGLYIGVRRTLRHLGAERFAANAGRYKVVSELFGAIKDVKLLGKEEAFTDAFSGPATRHARFQASAQIVTDTPRYLLEAVVFGGILLIAVYLLARGGHLQQVIPVLGLYAVAGYRLIPSLQQVYKALAAIRFGTPALNNLHRELTSKLAVPPHAPAIRRSNDRAPHKLPFAERLDLDHVTFTYPGAHKPAIEDVSLTIEANTTIGIMGPTGSGKTTLVDVLLGLLRPQRGEISIDGVPLIETSLRAWQNNLGYVPQHIYLTDDTVARNVAFGIPPEHIDMAAVERAARLAQIHDFITQQLPERYATIVGERGIRLSGGERQRLGIARALYHDPGMLIFDEATSALDHATEAAVMEAVQTVAGTRTILMIAHRLTTLRSCDVIHELKVGRLARSDTYTAIVGDQGERRHRLKAVR